MVKISGVSRRMKYLMGMILVICLSSLVSGQGVSDPISGTVTFQTSQNVYVRFESTKNISPGDTLFMLLDGNLIPSLIVRNTSSTSCVGTPINGQIIATGTNLVAKGKKIKPVKLPAQSDIAEVIPPELKTDHEEVMEEEDPNKVIQKQAQKPAEPIRGRISAASYFNFSDHPEHDKQRMRYTFTMNAPHIAKSKFSFDSYVSFRHTLNEWQEVKDNFHKAFKLYTLALQYDVNNSTRLTFGRKINLNLSNIGAIDGVQAEKKWKSIFAGAFAGSRPDHTDYDFNFNLLQFGAYAGNTIQGKNGTIQNTIAFAEQRNHSMTDRRFGYIQHINSLIKRVNVFTSFEFDLYTLENDKPKNTFNISGVYFSLRYKASDKLSLSGSYDARKNIIYYETYKNFIDQLLEDETRQGLRFNFNYRPLKYISIGSSAGYRFQKDNPNDSKNLHSYLTISRIPKVQASLTLTATLIESAYLSGTILGGRISRDLIKGKLFGEAEYRVVNYNYTNIEAPLKQSLAGANLSWRMTKKFSITLHYEGEFRNQTINHRIYTNLIHRL